MKALRLFQARSPYDAVPATPSAAGILVPYRVPAGPAALVRPQTKALVRWLRQMLHTGVYLATLRLPVGIVAWVYERRPRPAGAALPRAASWSCPCYGSALSSAVWC
ncbi:hypothetical protein O1L60_47700 [Streptomyces diastatochromogenes]|nr:hypothetical protein [Streptomyces diastatochromogenes]